MIRRVCETFEHAGLTFLIIGGQAVIRHGYVRTTQDVDVTVIAPVFDQGENVISLLQSLGLRPVLNNPLEAVRLSSLYRSFDPESGFGVDVSFVDSDYLVQAKRRAIVVETDNYPAPYLSLEDLLVHKIIAGRMRDHIDASQLMARYPEHDTTYVERWLGEFEQVLEQPLIEVYRDWRREALD